MTYITASPLMCLARCCRRLHRPPTPMDSLLARSRMSILCSLLLLASKKCMGYQGQPFAGAHWACCSLQRLIPATGQFCRCSPLC